VARALQSAEDEPKRRHEAARDAASRGSGEQPDAARARETTDMTKTTWALTAAVLLGVPLAGLAQGTGHDHGHGAGAMAAPGGDRAAAAAQKGAPRIIEMTVTSDGFVPAEVKVKKGERVRLAITRKTDRTCAKEIVVKDYGINQPLPLEKTVYVDLVPTKAGRVKYACGMDMITGFLIVE
jgi:hypothetical protein